MHCYCSQWVSLCASSSLEMPHLLFSTWRLLNRTLGHASALALALQLAENMTGSVKES